MCPNTITLIWVALPLSSSRLLPGHERLFISISRIESISAHIIDILTGSILLKVIIRVIHQIQSSLLDRCLLALLPRTDLSHGAARPLPRNIDSSVLTPGQNYISLLICWFLLLLLLFEIILLVVEIVCSQGKSGKVLIS